MIRPIVFLSNIPYPIYLLTLIPRQPHLVSPPLLAKFRSFEYYGDEFHWALTKSPQLEWFELMRPCNAITHSAFLSLVSLAVLQHSPDADTKMRQE
jgi:hypothetical protein